MKCPHCQTAFHAKETEYIISNEDSQNTGSFFDYCIKYQFCPGCHTFILNFCEGYLDNFNNFNENSQTLIYPKNSIQKQAPNEVPKHIAEDFNEAGLILNDSPKASAALSRRCLQTVIHEHFKIKERNLSIEIDKVMKKIPPHIAESIDAIRSIGNYAAHPNKSESTGEIVAVEPGEAEWALEVLDQLFNFCYVQPKILEQKRETLNKKLADIGKPPLKSAVERAE